MADSKALKAEAMAWLRFGRRMPIVCTEAGAWASDVLGVDDKRAIEIEVKVSKSDLQAEFRTKQQKHNVYKLTDEDGKPVTYHIPNQLYFLVPAELKEAALEILKEKAPAAGVAYYDARQRMPGSRMTIVKKAKTMHRDVPSEQFKHCCMLRMGSELISLYHVIEQFKNRGEKSIEETHQAVLELVSAAFTAKDHEETDGTR